MTRVGVVRDRYSRSVERRVSRFGADYAAWAARADMWGKHLTLTLAMPEEGDRG